MNIVQLNSGIFDAFDKADDLLLIKGGVGGSAGNSLGALNIINCGCVKNKGNCVEGCGD